MKSALLFLSLLLFCLVWMIIDIQITSHNQQTLNNFSKLSRLYTLQIEKNDFVYRKSDE